MSPRRLAEIAVAHPWRVLAAWGIAAVVGVALFVTLLDGTLSSEARMTTQPESIRAEDLIEERIPGRDDVDEVVVVRSEELGVTDPPYRRRVADLATELRASGGVHELLTYLDPGGEALVSADRRATIVFVGLAEDETESIEPVIEIVEAADGIDGFAVNIAGEFTADRDFGHVAEQDLRTGELRIGLPAAMVILLLVFGTLVGAAIPLTMAFLSIIVALGIVSLIGQAFELNLFIVNMLVAMGLALGIDYSLFIVSRLREERARGLPTREAILSTASTATRAVVFSGAAFSLALIGMFLVPTTVLRSLGLGAVVVALVSMVVALTFHPALLAVLGDRVDRLRVPWLGRRVAASAGTEGRFWGAVVGAVMRRPALSLLAATALLLAAASPVLKLELGAAGASTLPEDTVARQGLDALERDFPRGAATPIEIVVDARDGPPLESELSQLLARLEADPEFAADQPAIEQGPDLTIASIPLTVEGVSLRASTAIDRLRDEHVPAAFGEHAERVLVGGQPAMNRDFFALVGRWLPIVIAFVLALSFVLLTVAFRSIVVPLTAIAVNLLSVGAAYGLLVLVFQEGVATGLFGFEQVERIEAWLPLFLFSVLFGLSMDYQVFLLSRIRERYSASGDTAEAISFGVGSTARLITGAALIIVAVFAGFAAGDLVSFQQMGFGVAVALLIDATMVRSVVIPAAMTLLGERNWYLPSWLGWLPRVEIESAGREQQS